MRDDTLTEIVFYLGVCLVAFLIVLSFNWYKCGIDGKGLNLPYSFGPIQGCMVQINDRQRVDINRVRITSDGDIIVGDAE